VDKSKTWIWVRVPIDALREAIGALKERSAVRHMLAARLFGRRHSDREKADEDDQHAEDLKTGIRGWEKGEKPP
jgi:hypothetical protein